MGATVTQTDSAEPNNQSDTEYVVVKADWILRGGFDSRQEADEWGQREVRGYHRVEEK